MCEYHPASPLSPGQVSYLLEWIIERFAAYLGFRPRNIILRGRYRHGAPIRGALAESWFLTRSSESDATGIDVRAPTQGSHRLLQGLSPTLNALHVRVPRRTKMQVASTEEQKVSEPTHCRNALESSRGTTTKVRPLPLRPPVGESSSAEFLPGRPVLACTSPPIRYGCVRMEGPAVSRVGGQGGPATVAHRVPISSWVGALIDVKYASPGVAFAHTSAGRELDGSLTSVPRWNVERLRTPPHSTRHATCGQVNPAKAVK